MPVPVEQQQNIIETIIDNSFSRFNAENEGHQRRVFERLRALLRENPLDTTPSGFISPTGANLALIARILAALNKTITNPRYFEAFGTYTGAYELLQQANERYYSSLIEGFKVRPVYNEIRKMELDRVLLAVAKEPFREALFQPIQQVLNRYVTSSGDYLDLVDELTKGILGVKNAEGDQVRLGYLQNYYWRKRITRDALFGYNRAYNETVANISGLQWFYYAGGLVQDSRHFCRERHGKYWHTREIQSWANIPKKRWPEKMPDTNKETIFVYLGGWNCRHSLLPVSLRMVPKDDIARAIKKGFMAKAELAG